MAVKEKVDVREEILAHLKMIDRKLNWLATKTGMNYNTMYSIFIQKVVQLSQDRLDIINEVLETKFKK
jgi:lambda repressor-like predicted transcriptional regulator